MSAQARPRPPVGRLLADRRIFLVVLAVLIGAVMAVLSPFFLQLPNLLNMTKFGAVIGLLALGQTLVILGGRGGIDLSVGATLSLCGVVMGIAVGAGLNIWLAALVAILTGLALGAFNGLLVSAVGVPPLIATLGTLYVYASLALVIAGGTQITGFDQSGFAFIGRATILGVPAQVLLVLLPAYLLVGAVLAYTRWGRSVYQVGNSDRAALLVGISPGRVRFWLYAVAGMLAGVGAVVTNSWLLVARPGAGTGLELQAITTAVLGGTYIFGGEGKASGTLLAVLVVVILSSGLQLAGVDAVWQSGVIGAVLVLSVVVSAGFAARSGRR